MALSDSTVQDDLSPYQIHSRREITSLLRAMQERNQLVTMRAGGTAESVLTTVLDIDEASGQVIIDCAPGRTGNQRMLESDNVSFETVLDNIRILFFTNRLSEGEFESRPALCMAIPDNLIRLQRREYFRVPTPMVNPVRCLIQIEHETGSGTAVVALPLMNVSGGGIAIIDEKRLLDNTAGRLYHHCRIDLPGGSLVVATLEIRNSQEVKLANGRSYRRLGCLFVDLAPAMLAAVQRYITRLERERNTRLRGI